MSSLPIYLRQHVQQSAVVVQRARCPTLGQPAWKTAEERHAHHLPGFGSLMAVPATQAADATG